MRLAGSLFVKTPEGRETGRWPDTKAHGGRKLSGFRDRGRENPGGGQWEPHECLEHEKSSKAQPGESRREVEKT